MLPYDGPLPPGYSADELFESTTPMFVSVLPQNFPRFFVPRLVDKPQNPIMDTLKQASTKKPNRTEISLLPPEVMILAADHDRHMDHSNSPSSVWCDAMTRNLSAKNQILSWDGLQSSHHSKASPTAFLSEQDSLVFAAARYHVQPRLHDFTTRRIYVTQAELLQALKMTVLGTSSIFHTWDASSERFMPSSVSKDVRSFLLMDGKDEVISQSVIARFITIGTLLQRMETLLATLRKRSAREGPTIHAFAHSLSTVLSFVRDAISRCPPSIDPPLTEQYTLTAIWMQYQPYEEILIALSNLYDRGENKSPQDYLALESSPTPLLSRIYDQLNIHVESHSSHIIIAIFAFILTSASHEYLQQVSLSVGYNSKSTSNASQIIGGQNEQFLTNIWDEEDEENQDGSSEAGDQQEGTFPSFFPQELLDVLPAARKSLILLRAAKPDHPLLKMPIAQGAIRWFWLESEIEAAWNNIKVDLVSEQSEVPSQPTVPSTSLPSAYKLDLAEFQLFDLEPGAHFETTAKFNNPVAILEAFISSFPKSLPTITPTLAHLTSLVFARLVEHASSLSGALLSLFLSSSDTLNFQAHLKLLRSYLLLTSPPFKSRLSAALFSSSGDFEDNKKSHRFSPHALRRKSSKAVDGDTQPWAVGLAPTLLERETWPPVGADLSFFLRTVIVDSFESGKEANEGGLQSGQQRVLEEAEYRLGFAIRDLPSVPGRDKWLNPLSIEALDFLYMDYKPPHPLDVLITPDILAKYQRVFAFLLRLMRVESAVHALFRMTRMSSKPLFPTLASSRKLLLHFRFTAQSFISNLCQYVFDTAIGGNFDPFIAQLSPDATPAYDGRLPGFTDVFVLAKRHSALLDDILSACLLKSGQRAVGDVLRHALELVLEFTIVVGELQRGRLEEYQAAPTIEDLTQKFRGKMMTLTKVLKGLVDRNPLSQMPLDMSSSESERRHARRQTGGTEALYHLLLRLDMGDWWSRKA